MKKTIIIIITTVILILTISYVKADIPSIYTTVSEAEELKGDTDHTLNDDQYGDHNSVYTELTDGDTSSIASIKADTPVRLIYDIDGLSNGNYTLRIYFKTSPKTMTLYPYKNETAVDTSINYTYTWEASNEWKNFDITDIIRYSFNNSGRAGIRMIELDGDYELGEVYLREPITEATVDFLAQGVAITTIERWTENTWKIIADVNLDIQNLGCVVERVDQNHTHVAPVPANAFVDNDNQVFGLNWFANETQINESYSYRINCDVTIDGITFEDIYQFVYITREKSMWEAFNGLWAYIVGFMTNILISIEGSVNETLLNVGEVNETTQSIEEILLTPEYSVNVQGTEYTIGDNGRIFLQLTQDKQTINGEFCRVTVQYPDSVKDNLNYLAYRNFMVDTGTDGMYYYDFQAPNQTGIYMVNAECFTDTSTYTANATEDNLINGTVKSGSISDTLISDDIYYELEEDDFGGGNIVYEHEFIFDASNFPNVTNFTDLVGVAVIEGRINDDSDLETFQISAYNVTGGNFVNFTNLWFSQDSNQDIFITASPESTEGAFKNSSGHVRLKITDLLQVGDGKKQNIYIDRIVIGQTERIEETVQVAGGGELHITEYNNIMEQIWDYLTTTLNFLLMDINSTTTETNEIVKQINATTQSTNALVQELNITGGGNDTAQLNRIEEKLDNITDRPYFDLISR